MRRVCFVSSVRRQRNFQSYRDAAREAIEELQLKGYDVIPWLLPEHGPDEFRGKTPLSACVRAAEGCDIYIGIYGNKHSDVVEKEFDTAHERAKALLIFREDVVVDNIKQKRFIRKVERLKEGVYRGEKFIDKNDLKHKVSLAVEYVLTSMFHEVPSRRATQQELDQEQMCHVLDTCETVLSAPLCSFLCGDWSVLVTKKAILVPLHLRVTVGVKFGEVRAPKVSAYEMNGTAWEHNEPYSRRLTVKLTEAVSSGVEQFPEFSQFVNLLSKASIYVFSSVPFGSVLHEVEATILCIAATIVLTSKRHRRIKDNAIDIHRFCVYLLSYWYRVVSHATIVCSAALKGIVDKIIVFDRCLDGGIDLLGLYSEDNVSTWRKNTLLDPEKQLAVQYLPFDLGKISIILKEPVGADIPDLQFRFAQSLKELLPRQFIQIHEDMLQSISKSSYARTGLLMTLHQLLLSKAGFSTDEYDKHFMGLNASKCVYGSKFSCSRCAGAIVVLHDGSFGHTNLPYGFRFLARAIDRVEEFKVERWPDDLEVSCHQS